MSKNSLTVLAQKLAEKTGISQQDAELFIRKMFDVANEGLQADKQVKMKWLGTFKVTSVKDRESVDVNTGERIVIEGRDKSPLPRIRFSRKSSTSRLPSLRRWW